ncbi:hypothetical protein FS749_014076 [Ceratobasidium sp. UAMH 11750]|nr:hypothetical protein FS749_014076 [Ceratobasidium sp. UAMH 11750]
MLCSQGGPVLERRWGTRQWSNTAQPTRSPRTSPRPSSRLSPGIKPIPPTTPPRNVADPQATAATPALANGSVLNGDEGNNALPAPAEPTPQPASPLVRFQARTPILGA